ncbi:hypothetical protein BKE30_01365 [Alkanindiges hydrocarboniclasticus]|uniref:Pilus assembly protein n=1 Tax=Alkanindiges hydrocarboniclasticus TaxID=1907941 RepID=A0A1S8CZZ6_9GAMM|nr:pilus assembly PilX N-terminal domain-containing protein [Alkanindiges hydrocarboniclasticus]ONG42176.1 hypothetical protein BKE30_01365 [Alkanindiges hydrocarboniclasticus]
MAKLIRQKGQQGATLIMVLFVLLIITMVGVLAIRVAMTSLNVATNSQIGQLLLQTGDTPNNQILNTTNLSNILDFSGAVGAAIKEHETDPGKEYIFCYKPTSSKKLGALVDTTVLVPPASNAVRDTKATIDSTQSNRTGFCNLEKDFGSGREAVVTQIAITIPTDADADAAPGAYLVRDTDVSSGSSAATKTSQQRIRVTTTAILPAYASASLSVIQEDCIGSATAVGYINDNTDKATVGKKTMADCLAGYGVPVNSQMQEINLVELRTQTQAL